jgi:hypothetical protein
MSSNLGLLQVAFAPDEGPVPLFEVRDDEVPCERYRWTTNGTALAGSGVIYILQHV